MCTLLTEAEAAARLRISPRLLRELRKRGEISYVALSARRIAYRVEHCDAFVADRVKREGRGMPSETRPLATGKRGPGRIVTFSEQTGR